MNNKSNKLEKNPEEYPLGPELGDFLSLETKYSLGAKYFTGAK